MGKGLNRTEYRTYRKWIQEQLFQHAYNPLAMYDVMVDSAEGGDENYEASQAAKDELAFYLLCVEKNGNWPYLSYVPGHQEQVGRDIEELKRRLAAVPLP